MKMDEGTTFPEKLAPTTYRPSSRQLPKPNGRQSYLSSQFIPLDKAFLLPQLQMPTKCGMDCSCFREEPIASCGHRSHCHYLCYMNS